MSDFFAGIFDSLRSVGDDVSGFFDTAIGQAVTKTAAGAFSSKKEKTKIPLDYGMKALTMESDKAPGDTQAAESVDYNKLEREWFERLHRFSQSDTGTK